MRNAAVLAGMLSCTLASLAGTAPCGVFGNIDWPAGVGMASYPKVRVQVADMNGDGIPDVVCASRTGVSVSLGFGGNAFGAPAAYAWTLDSGDMPFLAIADLNGDGHPDVVGVVEYWDPQDRRPTLCTYFNDGLGGLTLHQSVALTYGAGPDSYNGMTVGDVNGDGYPDVLFSLSGMLKVAFGDASGTLATPVLKANIGPLLNCVGSCPISMALNDFNHDGYPDLMVSGWGVEVLAGSATGDFTSLYFAPDDYHWIGCVAAADVDGDGWDDVVFVNNTSPSVGVLRFSGVTFDPYGAPYKTYQLAGSPRTLAVADLNGDGHPDIVVAPDYSMGEVWLINTAAAQPSAVTIGHGQPGNFVLADMNGDGFKDVVYGDFVVSDGTGSMGSFTVLSNDGSGGFGYYEAPYPGKSNAMVAVISADVDHDGHPDLVAMNGGTAGLTSSMSIYHNQGDGTFVWQADYSLGANPIFAVAADMNKDGWPDIVFASGSAVYVTRNLGNGTFAAPTSYLLSATATGLAVGDLNKDGYPDVVAAVSGRKVVSVLKNNGSGGLLARTDYTATVAKPYTVQLADVNGDGNLDVVVGHNGSGAVSVWFGTGTGTIQGLATYAVSDFVVSLAVGDVDGDGRPDVVTIPAYGGVPSLLRNNGDGTFAPYASVGGFMQAGQNVKLADIFGSGHLDIVGIGYGVSVARGNGDGTFQSAQQYNAGVVANGWACIADFDGDGAPDFAGPNALATLSGAAYPSIGVVFNLRSPTFFSQPASQSVAPGASVTLQAKVRAAPPVTFQWKKDGVPLTNGGRIAGATTATLRITGATTADTGAYVLVADGVCATAASAVATVTVSVPVCRGDANCDHVVNWRDIDYFVAGLNDNQSSWQAHFPGGVPTCSYANVDANSDGHVNWRDIDPFVRVLNSTCP